MCLGVEETSSSDSESEFSSFKFFRSEFFVVLVIVLGVLLHLQHIYRQTYFRLLYFHAYSTMMIAQAVAAAAGCLLLFLITSIFVSNSITFNFAGGGLFVSVLLVLDLLSRERFRLHQKYRVEEFGINIISFDIEDDKKPSISKKLLYQS